MATQNRSWTILQCPSHPHSSQLPSPYPHPLPPDPSHPHSHSQPSWTHCSVQVHLMFNPQLDCHYNHHHLRCQKGFFFHTKSNAVIFYEMISLLYYYPSFALLYVLWLMSHYCCVVKVICWELWQHTGLLVWTACNVPAISCMWATVADIA